MTQHSRDTPQFYLTAPSPCPYLRGQEERKVFTHLVGERAGELNDLLTHGGFRRSQSIAYRPACESCRACVSVRVVANDFAPSRNMRRVAERNEDVIGAMRAPHPTSEDPMPDTLSPALLQKMDAYWRAANYLSVGQIYLQDNPLLEAPLGREHIKPRLLGHWGTTPGLNFLYVHLNRLIK